MIDKPPNLPPDLPPVEAAKPQTPEEKIAFRRRGLLCFDLGLDPKMATDAQIAAKASGASIETADDVRVRLLSRAIEAEDSAIDSDWKVQMMIAFKRATPEARSEVCDLLGLPMFE